MVFIGTKKRENEQSPFYDVVHQILEDRWNKSNTPLQCLAHSLNPGYSLSKVISKLMNYFIVFNVVIF